MEFPGDVWVFGGYLAGVWRGAVMWWEGSIPALSDEESDSKMDDRVIALPSAYPSSLKCTTVGYKVGKI